MKTVLLYSGGLDSHLASFLIRPDILLYLEVGSDYETAELEAINRYEKLYGELIVNDDIFLGDVEDEEDEYTPFRNIYMVLHAFQFGQNVYLGINNSDNAPDKTQKFADKMKAVMELMASQGSDYLPRSWSGTKVNVHLPYNGYSKGELIKMCLGEGMPPEEITAIRSCYDATSEKGCGVCSPCVAKAVALWENDLYSDDLYDQPIELEIDDMVVSVAKHKKDTPYYKKLVEFRNFLRK